MQQQLTGQAYVERYGHEWNVPERVREYVERTDSETDQRAEGFKIMVGLIPFDQDARIRVLDIGTGQGAVAAIVLDAFPNASAVGLDVSEPMMEIAGERMARYGGRFEYFLGDFVDGAIPAGLKGPFDAVVSARAIHHLPPAQKQLLYKSIYQSLGPGGCFFNLDMVGPSDEYLRARYREAGDALRGVPIDRSPNRAVRTPTPGHYFDTLDDQLRFLREAGFVSVDVFWKRLGQSVIGGYKKS